MTVQISFVPKPVGARGPAPSDQFNDMLASLLYDLTNVGTQGNVNELGILNVSKLLFQEFMNSRNLAEEYAESVRIQSKLKAILGETIYNFISFRSMRGPEWYISFDNIPAARQARVEPIYGQVLLPYNDVVQRMFSLNPETGEPIIPSTLNYTVSGEDNGGVVEEGTVKKAFNGSNRDYWIRKVSFPESSDVSSVAVTLTVTLPDTYVDRSNMLTLHAFPMGQLEVEELKYSTDSSDPSIDIPGFTPLRGASFARWHFADLAITRIKITLRQRNFIEENGQKVFYLGAQEIGLQLVDFDKTVGEIQPSNNNGVVAVLEAPEGYKFDLLTRLFSAPEYSTILSDAGIMIKIYSDSALTNLVWSSYDDPRLEDSPVDVSGLGVSKLYMLVNLSFITGTGVSPLLNDILIGYNVRT